MTLAGDFSNTLLRELTHTGIILLSMIASVPLLVRWKQLAPSLFLGLTVFDLLLLSGQRNLEVAPLRPLIAESPLLRWMASNPYGSRSLDPFRNLPMVAGISPVSAYRTLDRPVLSRLVAIAMAPLDGPIPNHYIDSATRVVGASLRIFDLFESRDAGLETIHDPVLARWLYGRWGWANSDLARFAVKRFEGKASRAWFLPGVGLDQLATDDPLSVMQIMQSALPVNDRSRDSEHFEVDFQAQSSGVLVISVLHDPGWNVLERGSGRRLDSARAFGTAGGGAWQGISIPAAGRWQIDWAFTIDQSGLWVSLLAWSLWLVLLIVSFLRMWFVRP